MPIDSEDPQKQVSFQFVSGESGTDGVSNRMYGAAASSTAAVRTPAYSTLHRNGNPAYNTLHPNGLVAETSMGTDGVSNRMYGATAAAAHKKVKTATSTADAGATLTAMALRQQVTMYKSVAAGLALLSFVLLIGLIVVSTAGNGNVGIYAGTTPATEVMAGAETAASAANATVGARCRSGSDCSGGRQCLGRCCSDGAGTNCIACGADGGCAACSPNFSPHPGSGTCTSKLKDGDMGCSTAAKTATSAMTVTATTTTTTSVTTATVTSKFHSDDGCKHLLDGFLFSQDVGCGHVFDQRSVLCDGVPQATD